MPVVCSDKDVSARRALRDKVLYSIVTDMKAEYEESVRKKRKTLELACTEKENIPPEVEPIFLLNVRNTLPNVPPMVFVQHVKGRKNADNLTRPRAKKRVESLKYVLETIVSKGAADCSKLFERAPKKIATIINNVTSTGAGVKVQPFGPKVFAAVEQA